jgi:hypothetical protein
VDSLLLVVVLLVGNVGDQLLVDAQPDVGQVDDAHCEDSCPGLRQSMAIPPSTGAVVPVMNSLSSPA